MRRSLVVGLLLLAACGEPPVNLEIPERGAGQRVFDAAGILEPAVGEALASFPDRDVVALTFEDREASLGLADRAGKKLLEAWDADVVLVAVAQPGDFASREDERERFFGIVPADPFAVPGSLRERIVEDIVPDLAADNRWAGAFTVAAVTLREELAP
jgi:hypothetical protein